jgi:hypothetical protein
MCLKCPQGVAIHDLYFATARAVFVKHAAHDVLPVLLGLLSMRERWGALLACYKHTVVLQSRIVSCTSVSCVRILL